MAHASSKVELYPLSLPFEMALVTQLSRSVGFFARFGSEVEADALNDPAARLILKACQAIYAETGKGPGSPLVIIQRLRRWMFEGNVTEDQIEQANELFDIAFAQGIPDEQNIAQELIPILRQRLQVMAMRTLPGEFANKGDLQQTKELLEKSQRIGVTVSADKGTRLGPAAGTAIDLVRGLKRVATGISELDMAIGGGVPRGSYCAAIGGSGDGKSMLLSHISSYVALQGGLACYATLELGEAWVWGRILANMTGISIDEVMVDSSAAVALIPPTGGIIVVKDFPPKATTVEEVRDWVHEIEDEEGRKCDVVALDYLDLFYAPSHRTDKRELGDYEAGEATSLAFRDWALADNFVGWTGCQSTRKKKHNGAQQRSGAALTDLDDVAGSMHKVRIADLIVTLNVSGDGDDRQLEMLVAKYRVGQARARLGPMPTDFARGRIVPISIKETTP